MKHNDWCFKYKGFAPGSSGFESNFGQNVEVNGEMCVVSSDQFVHFYELKEEECQHFASIENSGQEFHLSKGSNYFFILSATRKTLEFFEANITNAKSVLRHVSSFDFEKHLNRDREVLNVIPVGFSVSDKGDAVVDISFELLDGRLSGSIIYFQKMLVNWSNPVFINNINYRYFRKTYLHSGGLVVDNGELVAFHHRPVDLIDLNTLILNNMYSTIQLKVPTTRFEGLKIAEVETEYGFQTRKFQTEEFFVAELDVFNSKATESRILKCVLDQSKESRVKVPFVLKPPMFLKPSTILKQQESSNVEMVLRTPMTLRSPMILSSTASYDQVQLDFHLSLPEFPNIEFFDEEGFKLEQVNVFKNPVFIVKTDPAVDLSEIIEEKEIRHLRLRNNGVESMIIRKRSEPGVYEVEALENGQLNMEFAIKFFIPNLRTLFKEMITIKMDNNESKNVMVSCHVQ